jgi:dihydropteroate synthase
MHCQGDPKTMQLNPQYPLGAVSEVKEILRAKVKRFQEGGISPSRLWIDPGIGFGKTLHHNLDLLRHLDVLVGVGGRVVVGTSRKSFLGALMNDSQSPPETRDAGTLASHLWAFQKGASVFRVHDVGLMKRVLKTWEAVQYGCF